MKTPMTSAAFLAAVAMVLTFAAACGSEHAAAGGTTSSAASTPPPSVSLTIEVRPGAHAPAQHWTLTCDPAGGTLANPAAACAALTRVSDPFAPVKQGMMCPMIYAGPQTATIQGTWHGKHVNATFSRVDGCQTERWSRIAPVFGPYAKPSARR
jgi:hypothetical protein